MREWALTPFSPFRDEASSHINYLELYVIWYALWLWGPQLAGLAVVIWSDNVAAEGMVRNLWGTSTFIPLLKEIFMLCVEHNIRLVPTRIDTKANVIADALSRNDWITFAREMGVGKAVAKALATGQHWAVKKVTSSYLSNSGRARDYDDWMLLRGIFVNLNRKFGPFDVDATTDVWGSNSHCYWSWNINSNALLQPWEGLNVYCNPPYSNILAFFVKLVEAKVKCPLGTAGLFVVPVWVGEPYMDFILDHPQTFKIAQRFPKGSQMFTSPELRGVERRYCGATRWPVIIVRMAPTPLLEVLDTAKYLARH